MDYYKAPIVEDMYATKNDKKINDIYIAGIKVCSSTSDALIIIDYVTSLNKYFQYNKNLEQKVTLNFCVDVQRQTDRYINFVQENKWDTCNVEIKLSFAQKESVKSFCLDINNLKVYLTKVELDVLVSQFKKFIGEKTGESSFKYCSPDECYDNSFFIKIGELIPLSYGDIL